MNLNESILLLIFVKMGDCDHHSKDETKSKNPLPYFRRKFEGILDNTTIAPLGEDKNSKLVSFLVKNVKEIFDDIVESNQVILTTTGTTLDSFTSDLLANVTSSADDTTEPHILHNVTHYENLSLTTLIDNSLTETLIKNDEIEINLRKELMILTKEMKSFEKNDLTKDNDNTSISTYVMDKINEANDGKRSCILCNNVMFENCNDPQNTLIPTVVCERNDDLCYSQHTPFGIIDRGCFNVNHNLTTYVCACNLCNYISISEVPYIFSNKQDWIDNVIELSRTRNFRKSVFKDMSCLRCEVNTTTKTGDMLDSANCLEGSMGNLPIQDCGPNEICAVKAVRSDGYIWRGCVRSPLYNYWWGLCDTDLCNYDSLVSIYDLIQP